RRLSIETGSVSTESGRSEFESWIPKESVPVPRAGTAGCERQQKRQNISFPSGSSVWLRRKVAVNPMILANIQNTNWEPIAAVLVTAQIDDQVRVNPIGGEEIRLDLLER